MDIMLDKLNNHPKGKEIIEESYKIVDSIKNDKRFNESEMLLLVDLVHTKMTYDLFKIGKKSK